jgi:hypothetical protein
MKIDPLSALFRYNVVVGAAAEPRTFGSLGPILSSDYFPAVIRSEANNTTRITNPFAENVQRVIDHTNDIEIQFSRSPVFPFVGNITQLKFSITNSHSSKLIDLDHIHVTLINNASANFSNRSGQQNDKSNFVTFDNATAIHGILSLSYRFMEAGQHQVIVNLNTKDGRVALASFRFPVLKFWYDLF